MSLRGKIAGLFIVGFVLISFFALTLLHKSLQDSFLAIEQKQAMEQMQQLASNLNSELDRLNQSASDWGNWDDVYLYMQHPSSNFTDRHIIPASLRGIEVKFFALLDTQGNTVFSEAINLTSGETENTANFDNTLRNVKNRIARALSPEKACGLDISAAGPVLICWQPIRKTDLTGAPAGTLVMERPLNSALINKIESRSNIKFDLIPLAIREPKPIAPIKKQIELEKIEFSKNDPGILNALLYNIVGEPILKVRLEFSNYVSTEGSNVSWSEIRQTILITLLVGLALFICVNLFVFRRLQKMGLELKSIWRNGRWAERLATSKKPDEISELAYSINRILGLIRKQSQVLETIAHTDSLTQIANRRAFERHILIEMSRHNRNQSALSLLLIDLDHFNLYNDLYGHPAGDQILVEVAKLLTQVASRPSDLAARIGEEEFAVILPTTDLEGASHVAETLKNKLAELQIPNANSPISEFLTLSIGITAASNEDLATFLQRAEQAHNQAKQSGRNKICLLSPDSATN